MVAVLKHCLCKLLGAHEHNWSPWEICRSVVHRESGVLAYVVQERHCLGCGKVKFRKEWA